MNEKELKNLIIKIFTNFKFYVHFKLNFIIR